MNCRQSLCQWHSEQKQQNVKYKNPFGARQVPIHFSQSPFKHIQRRNLKWQMWAKSPVYIFRRSEYSKTVRDQSTHVCREQTFQARGRIHCKHGDTNHKLNIKFLWSSRNFLFVDNESRRRNHIGLLICVSTIGIRYFNFYSWSTNGEI